MLLFFLIPVSLITADHYSIEDHVLQKLVNNSIKPCDDLFRHVCGIDSADDLRTFVEPILKEELENLTVFDDVSQYLVELIKCSSAGVEPTFFFDSMKVEFDQSCKNGTEQQYLTGLKKFLPGGIPTEFMADCEKRNELDFVLQEIQNKLYQNQQTECIQKSMNQTAWLWMYRNFDGIKKLNNLFTDIKKIYNSWIAKTPWIKKHNLVESYQKLVNATSFVNINSLHPIIEIGGEYKKCLNNTTWLSNPELRNILCLQLTNKGNRVGELRGGFDAKISGNQIIYVSIAFYVIVSRTNSDSFLIGQMGTILAHEIGHVIIQSKDFETLFFSDSAKQCIQQQFNKSCSYFPEGYCVPNYDRLDENGSDLLAGHAVAHYIEEKISSEILQSINKIAGNLRNDQLFFYGQASGLCIKSLRDGGDTSHTPTRARFNAIAIQNPGFQKAFGCTADSPMIKSFNEKCYILGEQAPLQKK